MTAYWSWVLKILTVGMFDVEGILDVKYSILAFLIRMLIVAKIL